MKQIFICIVMLLISGIAMGQNKPTSVAGTDSVKVVRIDAKTFGASKTSKSKSEYKPTGYYYQLKSGEKREIYLHTKTKGANKGQVACYIKNPKGTWREINVKPSDLK